MGYCPTLTVNPQTFSMELWFKTSTTTGGYILGFSDQMVDPGVVHDGAWRMVDVTLGPADVRLLQRHSRRDRLLRNRTHGGQVSRHYHANH